MPTDIAKGAEGSEPVAGAPAKASKPGPRKRRKAKGPSIAVRKASFLDALRRIGIVSRAAREAGLATSTLYQHRARYRRFAADWDAALGEALDDLEAVLLDRARNGVEKPVLFQGKVVSTVRSHSDALAMFLLKAKRPELYDRIGGAAAAIAPSAYEALTEEEAKREVLKRLDRLAGSAAGDRSAADGDDAGDKADRGDAE